MKRALIVDDKEENILYLRALLESQDCRVDVAGHGAQALTKARQQPPDLVISDLLMPVMDGFTLLRHWKADPRLQKIPFMVYTASYNEDEDEQLALDLGADAFLLKPAEPEEILACINGALARGAAPGTPGRTPDAADAVEQQHSASLIRKLADKMLLLERTRTQLAGLIEAVEGIVYEVDATTFQFTFVSHQAERLLGYPVRRWLDEQGFWAAHIHPDDRETTVRYCRECTTRKENHTFECRLLAADGREVWVRDLVTFVEEPGQRPLLRGLMVDITAQKQAEAAQREVEERFRLLSRATHDAIWDWNLHTDQVWWSEGYETLFGYSRAAAEPSSKSWTDFIHPEDLKQVLEGIHQVIDGAETEWTDEYRFLRKDGSYAYVLDRGHVIRDARGKPLRMIGGMTDLTERKLAEEKLREQAELLDKAQDAIVVRDLNHRITYWNKSAERLYGWTAAEVLGRSTHELLYDDPSLCIKASQIALEQGEWMGEAVQIRKDRRPITVECRLTLVRDATGRPRSFLAINSDVTLRRKIEAQFLRHQRMESIGTLAGGIAHDLNNVLAPVLMSIELLRLDEQKPERLEILDRIESSARRGADLVRQVLSFARGVEGRRVDLNLAHLARDIEKIVRDTFPKGIEFQLRAARDLWTISGDSTQLHQVLINLCINARDAMADSGALTLTLGNTLLDEVFSGMNPDAKPGPYVVLQVADTGPGIPREIQERIFDPFFTTKEPGKGTGLGLSTVLTIVRSHGGFITVQSEPGRGAVFKVHLPAIIGTATVEAARAETPPLPRGEGELVLVVDDEEGIRGMARKTLEQFGYRVLLAAHGAEAVSLYAQRQHEIAVVLTDLAMPVMDGRATVTALHAINPAVKIIVSSGHAADAASLPQSGAGERRFIPKPYTAEALLTALDQVLRR
jgi:PAS domain S-box-containing protein